MTLHFQEADGIVEGVRGTLNYLKPAAGKPWSYTFDPPAGVPRRSGEDHPVPNVLIRNARLLAEEISLDKQGFVLTQHATSVEDFYDEEEVRDVYYPEAEYLLLQETRANKVVIFDHTIRSRPLRDVGLTGFKEPVHRVHNDYTEKSAVRRLYDLLDPNEAKERLKRRFAEINLWRPIKGPLEDAPLSLCDARTISKADLIASDLIYRDRIGEIYAFRYNESHRWYYFPRMQKSEALLIKCFDSDETKARFTAHSAFADPTAPEDAIPRESIELRALVFFGSIA